MIEFLSKASAVDFDLTKKFPMKITRGRLKVPRQFKPRYACLYGRVISSDSKFSHKVINSPCCRPAPPASWERSRFWTSNWDREPMLPSLPSPSLPTPTQRPVSTKLFGNSVQDSLRSRSGLGTANTLAIIFLSPEPRLQWACNVVFCFWFPPLLCNSTREK